MRISEVASRAQRAIIKAATTPKGLQRAMNIWPPFLGAGIRVSRISQDYSQVLVTLRDTGLNRNWVGTHFGGSLLAMSDPYFMIMLMNRIGPDFVVWDKRTEIEFVSPGRGTLTALFDMPDDRVHEIEMKAADGSKVLEWFALDILNGAGEVVAHVDKQLYIRRKRQKS